MGRKKQDRVMAFDTLQPDTLHKPTGKICRNFICYETKVKDCLYSEDRNERWKHDAKTQKEFDILTGYQTELRGGIGCLGTDMVSLIPVTLEKTVKTTTPYIYRIADYGTSRNTEAYGTRKDVLQYLQKRIKVKNVLMHYNGITERGEFDLNHIDEILGGLEENTVDFDVTPLGRGDAEGDVILITIYKNCLKI